MELNYVIVTYQIESRLLATYFLQEEEGEVEMATRRGKGGGRRTVAR